MLITKCAVYPRRSAPHHWWNSEAEILHAALCEACHKTSSHLIILILSYLILSYLIFLYIPDGVRPTTDEIVKLRSFMLLYVKELVIKGHGILEDELQSMLNYLTTLHEVCIIFF